MEWVDVPYCKVNPKVTVALTEGDRFHPSDQQRAADMNRARVHTGSHSFLMTTTTFTFLIFIHSYLDIQTAGHKVDDLKKNLIQRISKSVSLMK